MRGRVGWVPAPVFTRAGYARGHGGGRWCLRGQAMREDTGGGGFVFAGGGMGWGGSVCARTTGGGILVRGGRDGLAGSCSRGARLFARTRGRVRVREGRDLHPHPNLPPVKGEGRGRDGFTRQYRMHRLVWYEVHESMESARVREKALKKWYRAWKVRLVEKGNPRWLDLYEGIV